MIAVALALLAAASNAVASVLQRQAAQRVPAADAFRPALVLALVRDPVWLGGIAALIAGFLFQAGALSVGGLALVQPVLVAELPFTMLLVARAFGIRLDGGSWLAIAVLTAGLAMLLTAAAPGAGHEDPGTIGWLIAGTATAGAICGLVAAARLTRGASRAVLLGVAAGIGFSLTATFMKEGTNVLAADPRTLVTSWPVYAMVATGLASLFLLQNALQSGPLVAAQPALTVSDPVASIIFGVMLFGEHVRSGPWTVLEAIGIGMLCYGSIRLARSPVIREHVETAVAPRERSRPARR